MNNDNKATRLCTRPLSAGDPIEAEDIDAMLPKAMANDYFLIVEAIETATLRRVGKGEPPQIPKTAFEGRAFDGTKEIRFFGIGSGLFLAWEISETEPTPAESQTGTVAPATFIDRDYFLLGEWDGNRFHERRFPAANFDYLNEFKSGTWPIGTRLKISVREYRASTPNFQFTEGQPADLVQVNATLNAPVSIGHRFLDVKPQP